MEAYKALLAEAMLSMLAWVNNDCVGRKFDRETGLCCNAIDWMYAGTPDTELRREARQYMYRLMREEHGGDDYPFNDNDYLGYFKESDDGTLYTNQKRLEFMRKYSELKNHG